MSIFYEFKTGTGRYVVASESIKAFPCVWRGSKTDSESGLTTPYDKYSILNTEYNLSHLPSAAIYESYVVNNDKTHNKLVVVVGGYRFEISYADATDETILSSIKYIWIYTTIPGDEVIQASLLSNVSTGTTPGSAEGLDSNGYFYGLCFSTSEPVSGNDYFSTTLNFDYTSDSTPLIGWDQVSVDTPMPGTDYTTVKEWADGTGTEGKWPGVNTKIQDLENSLGGETSIGSRLKVAEDSINNHSSLLETLSGKVNTIENVAMFNEDGITLKDVFGAEFIGNLRGTSTSTTMLVNEYKQPYNAGSTSQPVFFYNGKPNACATETMTVYAASNIKDSTSAFYGATAIYANRTSNDPTGYSDSTNLNKPRFVYAGTKDPANFSSYGKNGDIYIKYKA